LPVVDHIRGTLPVAAEAVEPGYRTLVEELPAGVTHFALHCTAPGDVEGITPQHAPWRTNEYALFASGTVAKWCAALGIEPVGYRDIQRLWLRDR
jgi:chitin disaccharide deacetylase